MKMKTNNMTENILSMTSWQALSVNYNNESSWSLHLSTLSFIVEHLKMIPSPDGYCIKPIREDQYCDDDGILIDSWSGDYVVDEINAGITYIKIVTAENFTSLEAMRDAVINLVSKF